jgi:MoaD family protein
MRDNKMVVNIVVRFLGTFQRFSGKKSINLTFENQINVKDVIKKLIEIFPKKFNDELIDTDLNCMRPNALIIINGKEVSALKGIETEVQDSSEIVLIPMVHGG